MLGFSTLPEQVHRKAVKRGFQLTLMVVGESGLGKSTLINTLFLKDIYGDRPPQSAIENVTKTSKIEKKNIDVEERGVKLRLTVIDTPGFSDSPNAAACWQPIEDYVDGAFEQYFKDECGLNRKNIVDNRVHCCLYFLASYARGLRQVDVEFMRRLQSKVNIVPIISKADSLTPTELRALKERIREDIAKHRLQTYQFPDYDSDEDDDFKRFDADLKSSVPFAVIGSNVIIDIDGGARKARGRQYAWGSVEVENPRHSDFLKLRTFLISSHMQDLKDITKEVHYENFRARYITERMNRRTAERSSTRVPGATNTLPGGATGSGSNMTLVGKQPGDSSPDLNAILDSDALLKLKEDEVRALPSFLSLNLLCTAQLTTLTAC